MQGHIRRKRGRGMGGFDPFVCLSHVWEIGLPFLFFFNPRASHVLIHERRVRQCLSMCDTSVISKGMLSYSFIVGFGLFHNTNISSIVIIPLRRIIMLL